MEAIGRELRARRTAAGRTVASVAADAGLSVPYIANLENGRGNPTITALSRLADALGLRLTVTLDGSNGEATPPPMPASLVRLGRTVRFRHAVATIAGALGLEPSELSARLVAALAGLAQAMGKELAEADWWRILDALVLIASHPADRPLCARGRRGSPPGVDCPPRRVGAAHRAGSIAHRAGSARLTARGRWPIDAARRRRWAIVPGKTGPR